MKIKPLAALAVLLSPPAIAETPIPGIDGSWRSMSCELRPTAQGDGTVGEWWLTREISFDDGIISADFTTYAGPGCTFPLQLLSFSGAVDVLGASDVAHGAYEADLTIDRYVRITPLAEDFAAFLNSGGTGPCGAEAWSVGETQDILETGCAMIGVAPGEVTVEYEILAVIGDQLFFGERRVDGAFLTEPSMRPQALLAPLLRD